MNAMKAEVSTLQSVLLAIKFSDQDLTLADAHRLAIMRVLRIGCCWSTDRHLGLDGVSVVA
jgi:hypothetical protein